MILNFTHKHFTRHTLFAFICSLLIGLSALLMAPAHAKHLLIYGDSLSAAYGMEEEQGWVNLLQQSLGDEHRISNASISGETSGGGLARLAVTLDELSPDLVFLELGANDGLRGYSTELLKRNLSTMITSVQQSGAKVILASISLPSTYGPRYIDQFRKVYTDLSSELNVPLLDMYKPEFLTTPGYIQEDGLHPSSITQPIIRDAVLDFLQSNQLLKNNH